MSTKNMPTMHKPVPMGARVKIPDYYGMGGEWGVVAGIASTHVIFHYIVILDKPFNDPDYGEVKAVSVIGSELEGENGEHWRLE